DIMYCNNILCIVFFFSSRRRHTRSKRDWSSDVCSSDLAMKLDYDPNVKVQMIRPKNKHKSDIKSAIDETAKYPVKDTDFMTDDEERNLQRLADLEEGLYRKRLIS